MERLALAGDVLAFITTVLALVTETARRCTGCRRPTARYTPESENTGGASASEDPPDSPTSMR